MSDFPGSDHRKRMMARLSDFPDLLAEIQADYDRDQAVWDSANRERPPNPVYDRLVLTVYGVLYPDTPWFPDTDTMELASMKAKTYDIADAVFVLLQPCDGGTGCFNPHEHFGIPYG